MRSIFQVCYNTYKSDNETDVSDRNVLKHLVFSPRLFEIKLSQRRENVAYFQDSDTFVIAEGEACHYLNFNSGKQHLRECMQLHTCNH